MLAFNTDLTAEQRIEKASMALNGHRKWVPFIGISMIGERGCGRWRVAKQYYGDQWT